MRPEPQLRLAQLLQEIPLHLHMQPPIVPHEEVNRVHKGSPSTEGSRPPGRYRMTGHPVVPSSLAWKRGATLRRIIADMESRAYEKMALVVCW
jgi:hypothetical protein